MKENCLDIGTIQAFLDGELAFAQIDQVSGHIAMCDRCVGLLGEAEDESAVVFSVLEREFNTMVPTQRLWNKINDSIDTERESRSLWQKAYAYLRIVFVNPSIAAAASFLIVFGVFAAFWMNSTTVPTQDIVKTVPPPQQVNATQAVQTSTIPDVTVDEPSIERDTTSSYRVERAAYRPEPRRTTAAAVVNASFNSAGYLPGEESYVKTISNLSKTANEYIGTGIMRASERIAYERDMAVVNDAISKMKKEVRQNPRNDSAKQVLYASYQNKIDLLNSVSQREELMVSLR